MKKIIYLIVLVFITEIVSAQDIHFSNIEYSPMTLNPALAGANSNFQANINYRSQWNSLGDPFKTFSASIDGRLNQKYDRKNNKFALGLNLSSDKSGALGLVNNNFGLIIADHLNISSNSTIGLGLNFGLSQRSIATVNGKWASQYNGTNYDGSLSSGESLNNINFRYFDASFGFLYVYTRKEGTLAKNIDRRLNVGFSAFHVNQPSISFYDEMNEKLPLRYNFFANAIINLKSGQSALLPGLYVMQQQNFKEIMIGTYYQFILNRGTKYTGYTKPLSISMGLFGRFEDAVIAKLLFEWDQFSFGYAYDINTSRLSNYTNGSGANEIFLRFNVNDGGGFRAR